MNIDAQTVNRTMNTTKGTSEVGLVRTNTATGAHVIYFTKFVSEQIGNSSIAANTWTYNFAAHQSSSALNFPVSGASQSTQAVLYVWRPSNSTKVGTIFDGTTAATVGEGGTDAKASHTTTFSGASVSGIQAGDRLVFEAWISHNSGSTTNTGTYFFDGTVITLTETFVTDHASFIETPETITLGAGTTTVTQTSIQKYDIGKYLSQTSIHKYNLRKYLAQTSIHKYNIATLITVLQTSIQKYSLRKYLAQTTIQKYRMGGTVLTTTIHKYTIRKFLAQTIIHKYNILKTVAATASIQKYAIRKAVIQATIHKYSLRTMIAQTSIHRYHIISLFGPVPMTIQATRNFIVKFLTKL